MMTTIAVYSWRNNLSVVFGSRLTAPVFTRSSDNLPRQATALGKLGVAMSKPVITVRLNGYKYL